MILQQTQYVIILTLFEATSFDEPKSWNRDILWFHDITIKSSLATKTCWPPTVVPHVWSRSLYFARLVRLLPQREPSHSPPARGNKIRWALCWVTCCALTTAVSENVEMIWKYLSVVNHRGTCEDPFPVVHYGLFQIISSGCISSLDSTPDVLTPSHTCTLPKVMTWHIVPPRLWPVMPW